MDKLRVPEVYNFYGLTETGVENFHHRCRRSDVESYADVGYVPIGLPLPNNDIRIGEGDELWLSGCQTTPGYLGGVGADKFTELDGKRWYLTGDKVVNFKELWFCKGRLDSQVKVSGHRIELMDVEAHLAIGRS